MGENDDEKKKMPTRTTTRTRTRTRTKEDEKKDTTTGGSGSIFESAKSMFSSFVHSTPVEAVEEKGEELKEDAEEKAAEVLTLDFEGKRRHRSSKKMTAKKE